MNLEQCTKAELIQIIRTRVSTYNINLSLIDIKEQRIRAERDKADKLLEQASEEFHLYAEIANKINEDPESVTPSERTKALEHYKNYLDLNEKWKKIMFKEVEP